MTSSKIKTISYYFLSHCSVDIIIIIKLLHFNNYQFIKEELEKKIKKHFELDENKNLWFVTKGIVKRKYIAPSTYIKK